VWNKIITLKTSKMIATISAASTVAEQYHITSNRLEAVMTIDFARRRIVNQAQKTKQQCDEEAVQLLSILKSELQQVRTVAKAIVSSIIIRSAQDEEIRLASGRQVFHLRDLSTAWRDDHKDKGMAEKMWKCLYGVKDLSCSICDIESQVMRTLGWVYTCGESTKEYWPHSNGCVAPLVTEAFNRIRKLVLNPGKNVHGWTVCLAASRHEAKDTQTNRKNNRRTRCVFDAARYLRHKDGKSLTMFGGVSFLKQV
jgi:hypothetical protein